MAPFIAMECDSFRDHENRWMTGGVSSPGWMAGALPSAMMGTGMMGTGTGTDPGKIMGSLWANAPGPRVSAA